MAIALSAQMSSNLVSLTSVNSDMATTQNRLSTGKKVETVLDGAALYFRAKGLTEKSEALDPVNAAISAALSNVKVANKGIDTMYDNLSGLLATLKDARAKPITATTAINTGTIPAGTPDPRAAYVTGTNNLVDTTAALADGSKFQIGDIFAVSFTNKAGTSTTRYFEAAATTSTTASGASTTNTLKFADAAGLTLAFTTAFGTDDIKLAFNTASNVNQFTLSATDTQTSISISQTTNAGSTANQNAFLDFDKIFGISTTRTGGAGLQVPNGGALANVVGTQSTYQGTGNGGQTAANLETRRLAKDTYQTTLQQLANIAKDAYLPGLSNLLTGISMDVDLNEDTGDVVQKVQVGAVDPNSLGFTGFTAATGADNSTANNFNNDPDMTIAVDRVTAAMTTLRSRQNSLANHTTMLATRLDYNKSYQAITLDVATSITAADMTAEAAKMASAQNLQAFATNNLSVTKNAEQSLIQLLR